MFNDGFGFSVACFTGSERKLAGNLPSSELLGYFQSSAARTEHDVLLRKLVQSN